MPFVALYRDILPTGLVSWSFQPYGGQIARLVEVPEGSRFVADFGDWPLLLSGQSNPLEASEITDLADDGQLRTVPVLPPPSYDEKDAWYYTEGRVLLDALPRPDAAD